MMVHCPGCDELIPDDADRCGYCDFPVRHQPLPVPAGYRPRKKLWITLGVVLGSVALCGGLFTRMVLPEWIERARRSQCRNNLKQIGLALHNYHGQYGSFPPAHIADEAGRPMHSWRVLILPQLDHQALYDRYRFDEPWDGPNNRQLASSMPKVFECWKHESTGNTFTSYAGVFGPHSVFRPGTAVAIDEITDDLSRTAMVGEIQTGRIHWMEPVDVDVETHPTLGDPAGFSSLHRDDGIHILFADGGVQNLPIGHSVGPSPGSLDDQPRGKRESDVPSDDEDESR